jgi:hypothetical protein
MQEMQGFIEGVGMLKCIVSLFAYHNPPRLTLIVTLIVLLS